MIMTLQEAKFINIGKLNPNSYFFIVLLARIGLKRSEKSLGRIVLLRNLKT